MGVAIPGGGFSEDRASGALVVGGGLRFNQVNKNYLTKTVSDCTSFTLSFWYKPCALNNRDEFFDTGSSTGFYFYRDGQIKINDNTSNIFASNGYYRDPNSFYHVVGNYNGTVFSLYVNGVLDKSSTISTQLYSGTATISANHSTDAADLLFSQYYLIDGLALDSSYFGYTDALTNTWRPKKLSSSVAFGTNGFYLPFDGSAPIGQDQSGRGNNWTPVNFGGSNTLEKATGALPILNTDGGGKIARVGVRTDANASSLVLALPLVGIKSDFSNKINSGTTEKAVTATNAVASSSYSNFYGGSFRFDGDGDYLSSTTNLTDYQFGTGDFTIEAWIWKSANGVNGYDTIVQYGNSGNSNDGWFLEASSSRGVIFVSGNSAGSSFSLTYSSLTVNNSKWTHIAVTRSSGTTRLFVDGILVNSSSTSYTCPTSGSSINIGVAALADATKYWFNGYIQDLRIYKGLAKYTSNFIPASTDPDIVPDSPSGVSYSSNLTQITDGAVAFDGSGDYLSLANSADFAFGTGDFTIECFINTKSANGGIAYLTGGSTGYWGLNINSSTFYWQSSVGVTNLWSYSASSILDGNWHHISVSRSGSLSRFFIDGILVATNTDNTNYSGTAGSLYIVRDVNSNELNGFISNLHIVKGTALYTANFTPPSAPISSVANTKLLCCKSNSSATAFDVSPGSISFPGSSISAFRDSTSSNQSWDSSSVSSSTSQALGPDDIYWSDLGATCTVTTVTFAVNVSSSSNISLTNFILYYSTSSNSTGSSACSGGCTTTVTPTYTGSAPGNVYVTFSGLNLSARYLGITNGSGSYSGTLTYSNVVITVDNVEATNFNPFTANINTQRGKQSGYATWNPLAKGSDCTLSNGNLDVTWGTAGSSTQGTATIGFSNGKWYWETTITASSASPTNAVLGITTRVFGDSEYPGYSATSWGYRGSDGQKWNNTSGSSYGSSYTIGDVIGVLFDADNGTLTFYKNGISQGQAFSGLTSGPYFPAIGDQSSSQTFSAATNFGQKPFKFPPPAGFQPLTLANTPRPTIVRPDQYVGISTWTGTGAARDINVGWKPDFVWIKERGDTGGHVLYDTVRGATKHLASHSTNAEATDTDALTSFNNYGFSLGSGYTVVSVNGSTRTYVGWAWKAGGNSNTFNINDVGYATASAAGLTAGTITPTGASVNTKSGFSILTYTGTNADATISHGLGKIPQFIIAKSRNSSSWNWIVYHQALGVSDYLALESTQGSDTRFANIWGSGHTTSVFGVKTGYSNNPNGVNMVAYCWAEIPGFSKFGSYTGNGSSDGPVIITGFSPRWLLIKRTDASNDWWMWDTARSNTGNPVDEWLSPNRADAEYANDADFDFLSNGFKIRTNSAAVNASGGTYIYACWAETPSFNLYGAMSNAR